jgi:VWFA-related protein
MKNLPAFILSLILTTAITIAQTPGVTQSSQQQSSDQEDVIRISTSLVQTDVVVTDKNDQPVPDLKLGDFEVYDNGKKQDLKFIEFISVDAPSPRIEGVRPDTLATGTGIARNLSARDVRRVIAFVIDDLTVPYQYLITVRQTLSDFVENQMREGDLVAIIRTVGGNGLLQQFTSDKQLLRRAIAQLNVSSNPYSAFNTMPTGRLNSIPSPVGSIDTNDQPDAGEVSMADIGVQDISNPGDDTVRYTRGLISLSTADSIIDSLRNLPGRKSLVLFSSGVPIFEATSSGTLYTSISNLLHSLTDHAVRAGVVINTVDPRGLAATPGVKGFEATPARSSLGSVDPTFGRGGSELDVFGNPLEGGVEHMSLRTLSDATGGVTVVNSNDIRAGVEKVLARSRGYYILAYSPSQPFDNKFHKLEVRVKRDGLRVYKHAGYVAREDKRDAPKTKEEAIAAAVRSPLAKRDVDVSATLGLRFVPGGKADLGINLLIDPRRLNFKQEGGKYQTSYDVVGFVYDELGKLRGGFSETVSASLTADEYQKAQITGLPYYAHTQLPFGYYQLRMVVRETATGNMGTISRYVEVPNLSKGRLAVSSIFLHAVDIGTSSSQPQPLLALRQLTRRQDLRYSAIIYNAKVEGGKTQARAQIIISQNGKVLFREPEQPLEMRGGDASQLLKVGQIALSKVAPGHYVLTLIVTDPLADKSSQTLSRSIDFMVTD